MRIARTRGRKKAIVALARRMSGILHRMWADGTEFRWERNRQADKVASRSGGSAPRGTMSREGRGNGKVGLSTGSFDRSVVEVAL